MVEGMRLRLGVEQRLVGRHPGVVRQRSLRIGAEDDDVSEARATFEHVPEVRQQGRVDQDSLVRCVIEDELELFREEPVVDRVQHASGGRHPDEQLEVLLMVPGEGGDAAAFGDLEPGRGPRRPCGLVLRPPGRSRSSSDRGRPVSVATS